MGRPGLAEQQTEAIHRIDANTGRMASLVAQTVFGNVSVFTRGSFSFSNLNAAIAVRTG